MTFVFRSSTIIRGKWIICKKELIQAMLPFFLFGSVLWAGCCTHRSVLHWHLITGLLVCCQCKQPVTGLGFPTALLSGIRHVLLFSSLGCTVWMWLYPNTGARGIKGVCWAKELGWAGCWSSRRAGLFSLGCLDQFRPHWTPLKSRTLWLNHLPHSCKTGEMCNLAAVFTSISPALASWPMQCLPVALQLPFLMLAWSLPVAGTPVVANHPPETPATQCGPSPISGRGSGVKPHLNPQQSCSPGCHWYPPAKPGAPQPGEVGAGYWALPLPMTAPCTHHSVGVRAVLLVG